jgi:hypothetical protein
MTDIPSFDAFFSYASRADGALVRRVERFLEGLHRHLFFGSRALKPLNVCVDGSDLRIRSGGGLSTVEDTLIAHLARSHRLVVFCSADAKASIYVDREIRWWLANRDAHTLVPVVTEGADMADIRARIFPDALLEKGFDAAIWIDLRGARRPWFARWITPPGIRNPGEERLRLAALLHDYAATPQPWQRARRAQIALVTATALLGVGVGAGWYGWTRTDAYAMHQILDATPLDTDLQWQEVMRTSIGQRIRAGRRKAAFELADRLPAKNRSDTLCEVVTDLQRQGEPVAAIREYMATDGAARHATPPACPEPEADASSPGDTDPKTGIAAWMHWAAGQGRAAMPSRDTYCAALNAAIGALPTRDFGTLLGIGVQGECKEGAFPDPFQLRGSDAAANARVLRNARAVLESPVLDPDSRARVYWGLVSYFARWLSELPTLRTLATRYGPALPVPSGFDFGEIPNPLLVAMASGASPVPDPRPDFDSMQWGWTQKNGACVLALHGLGRSFSGDTGADQRGLTAAVALMTAYLARSGSPDLEWNTRTYAVKCIAASFGAQRRYGEGLAFGLARAEEPQNLIEMYARMQAADGQYALARDTARMLSERRFRLQTEGDIVERWLQR